MNESELCKHQDVTADLISEANDDVDVDDELIHLIERVNTGYGEVSLPVRIIQFPGGIFSPITVGQKYTTNVFLSKMT